jgi:integrase
MARGVSGLRDLALFQVAIDTMLHGPDLFNLTVKDVQLPNGKIRSIIKVARRGEMLPVRCAFSKTTASALGKWIAEKALHVFERHRRFGDGSDAARSREDRINGEVSARAHGVRPNA